MNTDALSALRDKKPAKAPWRPPTIDDFRPGGVIAIDQSLSACGAVALHMEQSLMVLDVAVFRIPAPVDGRGGRELDMRRALLLREQVSPWLARMIRTMQMEGVVHEAIPEGNFIKHPEASLLSAMAVNVAAQDHGISVLTPIHKYTHSNFTCGNSKATKKEHGAALMKLAEELNIFNRQLITNEALRDALSIGLTQLWSGHREGL